MKETINGVEFTPQILKELIKVRKAAIEAGMADFEFKGRQWLESYASYVIEYLSGRWKLESKVK